MDDPEDVQQLALVLVNPLDLNVEEGVRSGGHRGVPPDGLGQAGLVLGLDPAEGGPEVGLVGGRAEGIELLGVGDPAGTDPVGDEVRQGRVGGEEPAPVGDPVGNADKPVGPEVVEIGNHGFGEESGVEAGHAIHRVTSADGQVGHPDLPGRTFLDNRNPF